MIYRRDESFRFTFGTPIEGTFKILRVNGINGTTKEGEASIIDLSPNGIKFSSSLDLPINEKQLLFEVSFVLNEKRISMLTEPRWKKRVSPTHFVYGLAGLDSDETKKEIIEELKGYSKNNAQEKRS